MKIIEAIEFEDYEMEFRVDRQNHCESQDFSIVTIKQVLVTGSPTSVLSATL